MAATQLGMNSFRLILRFVSNVFPLVNTELAYWQQFILNHHTGELSNQALASIRDKKFHCQGGSIYSLYPHTDLPEFVRLVVALQTISDYLDNLCDRSVVADEAGFRQLHLAMTDALNPNAKLQDYYRYYPLKDDGGYLAKLVNTCQQQVRQLPVYHLVQDDVLYLAGLYSDLQTYKHLDVDTREMKMLSWIEPYLTDYPELTAWEFAAATGSTLGMFVLCAAASNRQLTAGDVQNIRNAYFPWICGLHILLDYFIDNAEDRIHGDLNFVTYYQNSIKTKDRLTCFMRQAINHAQEGIQPEFSLLVINGLLAMYLSDPKASAPTERQTKKALLQSAGPYTKLLYSLCRILRWRQIL